MRATGATQARHGVTVLRDQYRNCGIAVPRHQDIAASAGRTLVSIDTEVPRSFRLETTSAGYGHRKLVSVPVSFLNAALCWEVRARQRNCPICPSCRQDAAAVRGARIPVGILPVPTHEGQIKRDNCPTFPPDAWREEMTLPTSPPTCHVTPRPLDRQARPSRTGRAFRHSRGRQAREPACLPRRR